MSDLIVQIVDTVADPVQAELKSDDLAVFIGYNENDPLPAPPGPPGTPVEFRNSGTSIDWKYITDVDWTVLILLEDITPPGGGVTLPISQSDVDGLVAVLNGKADLEHTHSINEITGLLSQLTTITNRLSSLEANSSAFSTSIFNINNSLNSLNTAISNLSNSTNSQLQAINIKLSQIDADGDGVVDNANALGGLPVTAFARQNDFETAVNEIYTEISNKEPVIDPGGTQEFFAAEKTFRRIVIDDVVNLQENLNSKADAEHYHAIENVDGLQEALDSKASASDLAFKQNRIGNISGTAVFNFNSETDQVDLVISNTFLNTANFRTISFLPIETSETSLDDFQSNEVNCLLLSITDNTNFTISCVAPNGASGNYTYNYVIQYY